MQANPQSSSDSAVPPGAATLTVRRPDFPERESKRPVNRALGAASSRHALKGQKLGDSA